MGTPHQDAQQDKQLKVRQENRDQGKGTTGGRGGCGQKLRQGKGQGKHSMRSCRRNRCGAGHGSGGRRTQG